MKEKVEFQKDYPRYHNKRGGGIKSNKTFPLKDSYTFKFSVITWESKDDDDEDNVSSGSLSDEIEGILPVMNRLHFK